MAVKVDITHPDRVLVPDDGITRATWSTTPQRRQV